MVVLVEIYQFISRSPSCVGISEWYSSNRVSCVDIHY